MNEGKRSKRTRRKSTAEFKAKIALEAIKAQQTVNEIATRYEVHPHQVGQWKLQMLREAAAVFEQPGGVGQQESIDGELYEQIGRLKMELEWLKKKLGPSLA